MSVLDTAKARSSVRAYTEQAVPESANIYIEGNQSYFVFPVVRTKWNVYNIVRCIFSEHKRNIIEEMP